MKPISNRIEVKHNMDKCIELIISGKTSSQLSEYWQALGYTKKSGDVNTCKCYKKIRNDILTQYPNLREKHIAIYQKLCDKMLQTNQISYYLQIMKRIEVLTGLEAKNDNISSITNNNQLNNTNIIINVNDL